MIHYTQHQKRFLKQVAELFPRGTKNEYWALVQQQLEDGSTPTDSDVTAAAAWALGNHSIVREHST
jgi:hypothetical protein